MKTICEWNLLGAENEPIVGNCHLPADSPKGVVLIAHGFKGYKDYGMFPRLAEEIVKAGFIVHRFNFSHSGMTNNLNTFERPDLFEKDTWNKQVMDLQTIVDSIAKGTLAGRDLPYVMFGHSRGGAACLLAAGRYAQCSSFPIPAGIVTASAPSTCRFLTEDEEERILQDGYVESPSSRTRQILRVGRAFLQEQIDEPDAHDLLSIVKKIRCPILFIHGSDDPTVPCRSAHDLADACGSKSETLLIQGGNHVYGTTNPMLPDQQMSPQLTELVRNLILFSLKACKKQ